MKRFFTSALLLVVALSSCSENEIEATKSSSDNSITINVAAAGTKGTDMTTALLEDSEDGVDLHILDSGTDDAATSGAYNFTASGSDWSQSSSSLTWDDIDFPAYFFSMHDGGAQSLTLGDSKATLVYSVQDESSTHNDLVYHASVLSAIPTGGTINVFHKHALSKINLYAGTGTNKFYVARVNLVNIDGDGTATITPVSSTEQSTANGVTWENSGSSSELYEYYYVGTATPSALQSSTTDGVTTNPIINSADNAPLMIIPQTLTALTAAELISGSITGSYIEVIYYLTDSNDAPLVGYSSVSIRSDADKYIDLDQTKVLYVKAAFPVGSTFAANMQYNITLGVGMDGSTGGLLVEDNYVNENGEAITLTDKDTNTTSTPELPEIEVGDEVLGSTDDKIDIIVTADDWGETTSSDVQ